MKQVILWWYNREKRLLKYKLTKYVCSCHDKVFWWTLDREYKLFLFLIDNTEWKPYLHKPYLLYRPKKLRNVEEFSFVYCLGSKCCKICLFFGYCVSVIFCDKYKKVLDFHILFLISLLFDHIFVHCCIWLKFVEPLSANPTKWSNTLEQFIGNFPMNSFCVFDHFVGLALKGLRCSVEMVVLHKVLA